MQDTVTYLGVKRSATWAMTIINRIQLSEKHTANAVLAKDNCIFFSECNWDVEADKAMRASFVDFACQISADGFRRGVAAGEGSSASDPSMSESSVE